ncbi:MAG TPA: energy transducer TonB [Rudaea sp.]|nr:energy transducer TonB [Rudaea sp.]
MAARNPRPSNSGNPVLKFLPIVIILIGVAVAVYFFLPRGGNGPAPGAAPSTGTASTQATSATPATPAPELTKEQLLKEAGTAVREQRYVSPPGNNAVEYYLRVLDKEPTNETAKEALRETFPFATPVVEANINAGSLDEATREIDVLAKADPNNYTLTILRGKLDAKKKQTEREQAQQAAVAAAAAAKAAAAGTNAAPAAATPATAPAETAAASAAPATTTTAAARPAPTTATPAPAAAPATAAAAPAPAPGGETRSAELVKSAPPEYPAEAYRRHQEGWVEVEFTVMPDGTVSNATVVNANPTRVFNDAALRAVQRWSFKPKLENGKAVEERIRRRIEFKLG